jgi:hypothetical protein
MRSIISRKFRLPALLGAAILVCGALMDSARADNFRVDILGRFDPPLAATPIAISFNVDDKAVACDPSCVIQDSRHGSMTGYDIRSISDLPPFTVRGITFTFQELKFTAASAGNITGFRVDVPLRHGATPRIQMKFVNGKGFSLTIDGRHVSIANLGSDRRVTASGSVTVRVTGFAGKHGSPQCHGRSVAALASTYGGLAQAARALNYSSVDALQDDIAVFCGS